METSKDCKESRTNNRARRPRSEPPSHVRLAEEENQDQETFCGSRQFFLSWIPDIAAPNVSEPRGRPEGWWGREGHAPARCAAR